jgi:DNA-binding transcriptional LysR family regulator
MALAPLNALAEFLVVARRRSFAAAARELQVSPSALSQAILKLEERLGVSLLARTTRSVALTDAGRRLLEQAGPGLAQAMEALRTAGAPQGTITGRIALSVPDIALSFAIHPVLPRFVARHPGVDVEVQVDNRLIDIVAEGFDAGVRTEEFLARDMVHVRLGGPYRFVVVGAPAYLARRGVPELPRDLLAHECISYRSSTTGQPYPWDLERGKRRWRVPVGGRIVTNHEEVAIAMTEAGVGLSYQFEPRVARAIAARRLRVVLEGFAAEVQGLFLYFPSRAQVSPALRAFIEVAREVAAREPG